MKNLGCHLESNPGPLASATSALTTEIQQPSDFQDLHIFPLYCRVVPLAAVSYSTTVDILAAALTSQE